MTKEKKKIYWLTLLVAGVAGLMLKAKQAPKSNVIDLRGLVGFRK